MSGVFGYLRVRYMKLWLGLSFAPCANAVAASATTTSCITLSCDKTNLSIHSVTLGRYISSAQEVYQQASALLAGLRVPVEEIRGLGITVRLRFCSFTMLLLFECCSCWPKGTKAVGLLWRLLAAITIFAPGTAVWHCRSENSRSRNLHVWTCTLSVHPNSHQHNNTM